MEGKGPERLELERSIERTEPVDESQTTPFHLQGVSSRGSQSERTAFGSSKPSLARWRYKPSWFKQKMRDGDRRRRRSRKRSWRWRSIFPVVNGEESGGGGYFGFRVTEREGIVKVGTWE